MLLVVAVGVVVDVITMFYLIAGTGTWTAPDFIPPTRRGRRKTPNDELLIVESPYKKSHPNFDVHYERQKTLQLQHA